MKKPEWRGKIFPGLKGRIVVVCTPDALPYAILIFLALLSIASRLVLLFR